MVRTERFLRGLGGLCVPIVIATTVSAAPPVRTMYAETLAREQTVRTAIAAADASPAILADARAVIAAYERLVRRYPGSGYSDNALWQAGRLALDAYARFGQPADKDAAIRLLRKLAETYPTSKMVKQVPDQLARIESSAAAAPAPTPTALFGASPLDRPRGGPDREVVERLKDERPSAGRLATIKEIRRAVLPDAVRITIELDAEVPFHDERIADPSRVFVDLPGTRPSPALADQTLRFESDADVVRQVRIGRHPNSTTRVVLDAAGIVSYSVYPLYGPYRLVIDCVRSAAPVKAVASATAVPSSRLRSTDTAAPFGETRPGAGIATAVRRDMPAPLLSSRRLTADWRSQLPGLAPRESALVAAAYESITPLDKIADLAPVKPVAPATMPAPPALAARHATDTATSAPPRNLSGGFSIARQLGLGISRIVIDAGHGGHDPGAKGKGVTESELVLDVALRLEKLLQKVPGVEVILTRRTDDFIPLPERTAIANREGADLFLSIHANASPNAQARGIETYFLNFATNLSAAAVAARENAASGQVMGALPDLVKMIALNNKLDESRDFATQVQRAMYERLKSSNKTIRDLGVKQAPFVVLIGAAMPSVLAEISFVTNPQEAKLLKQNAYRQRIAESLFHAIRKYQTSLRSPTAVALQ
jgi:N-acetylmuramoyl-L-alanine amidase